MWKKRPPPRITAATVYELTPEPTKKEKGKVTTEDGKNIAGKRKVEDDCELSEKGKTLEHGFFEDKQSADVAQNLKTAAKGNADKTSILMVSDRNEKKDQDETGSDVRERLGVKEAVSEP